MKLLIRGSSVHSIFSIPSDEFCQRQTTLLAKVFGPDFVVVMRADIIATDTLLTWLSQTGPALIRAETGEALLAFGPISAEHELTQAFDAPNTATMKSYTVGQSSFFARKLRRREPITVYDLRSEKNRKVEKAMFDLSYKGITDCVTKYVFPIPTWHAVQLLSRLKITPNMVTIIGIILCVLAAVWFYQGLVLWALLAGWIMTFLDTVDGKLARVTATSSKIGNILDHGTDLIHPPFWWVCIGMGILKYGPNVSVLNILWATTALVLTYFIGRFGEEFFKRSFGFNAYMWRPFDKYLRLFIARRNTILVILTLGFVTGFYAVSFYIAAAWSVLTISIQLARLAFARHKAKAGETISIFLREEDA